MFLVHRAERADTLADALADELTSPLADPMQTEIVAVPARGVERWLQQHLATTLGTGPIGIDGIAANIDFSSPTRIVADIVARLSKDPSAAENWRAERLMWPIVATLDEHLDDPRLAVLAHHVGRDDSRGARLRRGRRLSTARTIAALFDSYAWQRPTMLREWAAGHDVDGATGTPTDLPDALSWQPWFWRLVRERIGVPHLAEELDAMAAALVDSPDVVDLPSRLAIFGPTRIPQMMRDILRALAVHRTVNLYLPHPSDALWRAVEAGEPPLSTHRSASSLVTVNNPLLASLSRDVVELQSCLRGYTDSVYHPGSIPPRATLLTRLQSAVRADVAAAVADAAPDTSLEIHSCHGPERQVEVLRDRLLRLFADNPTLQPRDVLIMCPDVEVYAPLIRGAFGQTGLGHPAFQLRVRLADRGLRQTNDVLDAVVALLELAAGRATVGDILDFAGRESVRARFGFSDDDLDTLANWVERANIRWGVDNTQRTRFGLGGFPQGTAQTGLDRILLGVVADESEDEWLSTALPLSGVDSTDTDLAGRFAEFVTRLGELLAAVSTPRSASSWAQQLTAAVDLLTGTDYTTEWQRAQAVGLLTDALELPAGIDPPALELNDIRDLMTSLLAARPTRANFRTGELTVCSMVPMRSVPHRAIILLGMDDGVFPRHAGIDGDDVLGVVPLIGERDVRNEDRQVFLDAVTAARDHLLVFYSGADPVSGVVNPPAVVVSELIDAINVILDTDADAPSPVVHRHSLHAFDAGNFRGADGAPRSFDAALLPGARALAALVASRERGAPRDLLATATLPATEPADIELDDLVRFLVNPLEGFVRQRLGGQIPEAVDGHPDQLQVKLDPLDAWGIGDRFLAALLGGDDVAVAQQAELRRGTLPPFTFGARAMTPITDRAQSVFQAAQRWRVGVADAIDVRVELPDGRRIYGTVGDIYDAAPGSKRLCSVTYSSLSSKHRLQTWVKLLALAANTAPAPTVGEALVIGRGSARGQQTASSRFTPPADALDILSMLVAFRDVGLTRPISLPLSAANACAKEFDRSGNYASAARRAGYAFGNAFADWNDDYLGLVFADSPGAAIDFDTVTEAMPAELDVLTPWLGGAAPTPMFVRVASAIFGPLQQNEDAQ